MQIKPVTLIRIAIIQKQTIKHVIKDMEKLEPSDIAGGNIKCRSYFEIVWQFLKILNIILPYGLAIHTWRLQEA